MAKDDSDDTRDDDLGFEPSLDRSRGQPIAAGAHATPAADIDVLLDSLDRAAEEERD